MQIKYSNVSISDSGWDSTGQISSLCLLFTCGARSLLFCSKATRPWEPIPINQVLSWRRFLVLVTRQIENITAAISRSAQLQAHNDTERQLFFVSHKNKLPLYLPLPAINISSLLWSQEAPKTERNHHQGAQPVTQSHLYHVKMRGPHGSRGRH